MSNKQHIIPGGIDNRVVALPRAVVTLQDGLATVALRQQAPLNHQPLPQASPRIETFDTEQYTRLVRVIGSWWTYLTLVGLIGLSLILDRLFR